MSKKTGYRCVLANANHFIDSWTERQLTKLWGTKEERDRATVRQPNLMPLHVPNIGHSSRPIDFGRIPKDQGRGVTTFPRYRDADPTYAGRYNPEEEKRRKLFED